MIYDFAILEADAPRALVKMPKSEVDASRRKEPKAKASTWQQGRRKAT